MMTLACWRISFLATRLVLAAVTLAAAACMEDPALTSTESSVILNNSSMSSKRCEGYTSGGGQRVRGDVVLQSYPQGQQWVHTVSVEASNWKKNFGWNTKRTAQLAFQGYVYLSTSAGGNGFSVSADTGGELETRIGAEVARIVSVNSYAEADVQMSFYGRDGTQCSM
jgi:hypothetical protein